MQTVAILVWKENITKWFKDKSNYSLTNHIHYSHDWYKIKLCAIGIFETIYLCANKWTLVSFKMLPTDYIFYKSCVIDTNINRI